MTPRLTSPSRVETSSASRVEVLRQDRFDDPGGWLVYSRDGVLRPADVGVFGPQREGILVLSAPWWVDHNHAHQGMGYLHVVAAQPLRGAVSLGSFRGFSRVADPTVSLAGARVVVEITSWDFRPQGSHLYVWFQKYNSRTQKADNYAYVREPLELRVRDRERRTLVLDLEDTERAWAPLGASKYKAHLYGGGMPIAQALRHVNVDFGFILIPVDPEAPPSGRLLIHRFSLEEDRGAHEEKQRDYREISGIPYAINAQGVAFRVLDREDRADWGEPFSVLDVAVRRAPFSTDPGGDLRARAQEWASHMGILGPRGIVRAHLLWSALLAAGEGLGKLCGEELVLRLAFRTTDLRGCRLVVWEPGFDGEDPTTEVPLAPFAGGA